MNKDCIKADKFDLSISGKFNQKNRRIKSKARRKESKETIRKENDESICD